MPTMVISSALDAQARADIDSRPRPKTIVNENLMPALFQKR